MESAGHSTPVELVLSRLHDVKRRASGAMAICPAHADEVGSLKVDESDDGCALLNCYAGCKVDGIVAAIGLTLSDLFPRAGTTYVNGNGARPKLKLEIEWTAIVPAPADAPPPPAAHPRRGPPDGRWTYRNAQGQILTHDYRFNLPNGGKDVLPLTYAESSRGKRAWRFLFAKPRPLYGLDRLAQRPDAPVVVVEGCKKADAGAIVPNYVFVSWQGGAGAVKQTDWKPLANRTAVLWPDNDPSGFRAVHQIAQLLHLLGCRARFVAIPDGKPVSWDIANAVAEGMTTAEIIALVENATETNPAIPEAPRAEGAGAHPGKPGHVPEFSDSYLVDDMERRYGGNISHCRDH